ncbi:MAG TPA: hypothetical protein VHO47_02985 [Candidatus Babeliales bacterium]|nr:hypothetical protein [Candidatus Babeliales bacterium]
MKKTAFILLMASSLAHAQSHDTFFSTISSWLVNHKLGIAGIGLIGGGLFAKRIIHGIENKRLDRYRQNTVVDTQKMNASEISTLINKKVQHGFSESSQIGENYDNSTLNVTFRKNTTLGKELEDKITLTVSKDKHLIHFKNREEISISSSADEIFVKSYERELKNVGYANWVQNAFIGIGALAVFKSFALSNR